MSGGAFTLPRFRPILHLALRDLLHGWPTTLCLSVAVAAALLPLLVLFGLKFGVVNNLITTLRSEPNIREIRLGRESELSQDWFERVAARDDVGFLLPLGNFTSASIHMRGAGGGGLVEPRMVPTAVGDPLLGEMTVPAEPTQIILTELVAIRASAQVGDTVELIIRRSVGEELQAQRLSATVVGILPRDRLQTEDILVDPLLETAVESWRRGFAVPEFGWPSQTGDLETLHPPGRSFAGFRLYARDVRDVPILRDFLLADGLDVLTRAEKVVQALVIERALTLVFLAITTLGAVGFLLTMGLHLAASVADKARELAILRLLGMTSTEISLMPSLQGMVIAGLGAAAACLLALMGQPAINTIFEGIGGLKGQVSTLAALHLLIAMVATMLAGGIAGSFAGARSAAIEPRRGLRFD